MFGRHASDRIFSHLRILLCENIWLVLHALVDGEAPSLRLFFITININDDGVQFNFHFNCVRARMNTFLCPHATTTHSRCVAQCVQSHCLNIHINVRVVSSRIRNCFVSLQLHSPLAIRRNNNERNKTKKERKKWTKQNHWNSSYVRVAFAIAIN